MSQAPETLKDRQQSRYALIGELLGMAEHPTFGEAQRDLVKSLSYVANANRTIGTPEWVDNESAVVSELIATEDDIRSHFELHGLELPDKADSFDRRNDARGLRASRLADRVDNLFSESGADAKRALDRLKARADKLYSDVSGAFTVDGITEEHEADLGQRLDSLEAGIESVVRQLGELEPPSQGLDSGIGR